MNTTSIFEQQTCYFLKGKREIVHFITNLENSTLQAQKPINTHERVQSSLLMWLNIEKSIKACFWSIKNLDKELPISESSGVLAYKSPNHTSCVSSLSLRHKISLYFEIQALTSVHASLLHPVARLKDSSAFQLIPIEISNSIRGCPSTVNTSPKCNIPIHLWQPWDIVKPLPGS